MKLKITWMNCLITGTSLLLLMLINGCNTGEVEYRLGVDFKYVNHTDSTVKFNIRESIYSNRVMEIILPPHGSSEKFYVDAEGGYKDPNPQDCCQGILSSLYIGGEPPIKEIVLNDTLCVIHDNERSALISNYSYEIVSERHYSYSYIFTEDDFAEAEACD